MGLNRIYKVIWSKTKGRYVVVSEMAKRVGRNKAKAIVMATAAMAMAVTPAVMNVDRVEASVLIGNADGTTISANGSTVSSNGITIGGAITKAGSESVHIGDYSGSMGSRNVVIGTHATAGYDESKPADNPPKDGSFNQSVAIGSGRVAGEGARAYGDQSIAIGSNTIARGNSSIAIGNDDVDKTETIMTTYTDLEGKRSTATIGTAYNKLTGKNLKWDGGQYTDTSAGEAAVAIGVKAEAGDISLALGTGAKAKVVNGVAIGSGATANRDNAVAIGGGATTDKAGTKEVDVTVNGLRYTWKGGENTLAGDVVSFGKEGYERQLKHVAAGRVAEDSTDAINGSQFFGVLQHLTTDPVYFYGADNSSDDKVVGDNADLKAADAKTKKVVARSMSDSRLDFKGGATGELTDNNIGVVYGDEKTIKFKLAKQLTGLTSAEFKDANNNVVNITPTGVTFKKPNATGTNTVTLNQNGLNNGGNAITNVEGNLQGSKSNSAAPTTSAIAPTLGTGSDQVNKNNAATVGDVLEAGWNLQEKGVAKDFVKPYDTVNFIDGDGTSVAVDNTNGTTSTVKYNVNLGNGLEKNSANKITIKPADKSLEVTTAGLKAKTDGTTITTDPTNGLKVVTGEIEAGTTPGTVKVTDGDDDKIATVDSVVKAVNNAAFTLKASADGGTRNGNSTVKAKGELIKAGSTIDMIAGKNLEVTHNQKGKITFATVENPSFNTVQIGDNEGPKFSATSDGNIKVSDKDDTKPVKITNVKDGEISKTSKDAINGSQFYKLANNTIKLAGQNGEEEATETDPQNLNQKDGIKFTVKSSDGTLLDVTAVNDTITLAPKTGTITTTEGVPTAVTKNGKLVSVDEVVKALKDLGWKATAGTDGTGTMIGAGATEELIKSGNTVTFKAGNNLAIKQDGKNFIYSLKTDLKDLTSAEFKDANNNAVKITPNGVSFKKPNATDADTVTLNQNGLNNGGNPITNVAGNLQGAKPNSTEPTTSAIAPSLGNGTDQVNKNNAATVGDVLNAGWNLQEKGVAKDFVKPYDTVNFIDGDGTSVAVATANDGTTSTVKYSVNLGNGLEKTTDNKITVKPGDKSLEVTTAGLKAKTDNTTITTGDSGLKVVTGGIEAGTTPGTMKVTNGDTGKIATVDSVVDAVNNAAFTLKASATTDGTRNTGSTVDANGESIKAGNTIEMIAGKNLNVTHNTNGKIIFATVENPSFNTVQIGNSKGPRFSATSDGNIKVSDKDDTKPVKITNVADGTISDTSKDAINGSQIHKLVNKAIKLAGQNGSETAGETDPQNLTQQDPIKFTVKSSDGTLLHVAAAGDTITLTPKTGTITTGEDGIPTANTTGGKLVTADNLVKALTEMGWKATAGTDGTGTMIGAGATEELIKSGNTVTFKAGNNLAIKQDGKNFIYSLKTDLKDLTSAEFKDANNNAVKITPNGVSFKKPNATDADTVTLNQNGLNNGGNPITNVISKLENYNDPTVNGKAPVRNELRKFDNNAVPDTNVATVGDLRNMGWVVSSNKTTGDLGNSYSETVKNADEVKFVGTGLATVSGKTENGVRIITVDVESKTAINAVTYTKADGTKVYPVEGPNGTTYHTTPEGKGPNDEIVDGSNVITSVNGPKGTKTPSTLTNVEGNLEGAKTGTNAPTTSATAPTLGTGTDQVNKNNAATVGDVLNAGWNLQGNGTAVDFVKPYDTVNFVNGLNTTAVVSTVDGKTSNVTYNVTGLPVTYTTEDGTPVTKIGDKYYKVNDQGQPLDSTGAPVTKFNKDGKPLDANGQEVPDVNITDKPLKTSLVNPAPEANKTGTTSPTSLSNVKNNIPTVNDEDKTAHKADGTAIDGKNNTEAPITAGDAANLLKPTVNGVANPNFVGNNAATVSDVLNAGWNLQNNGTAKDFVKPYDTVNFVNGGNTTAVVTTNAAGTASDVTFNVTGLPVTYTTEDGAPVSKVGDKYYKVNDKGQPISDAGKPAVGKNNDGKLVDENNNVIEPIDTTKPLKTALVNPTPAGDKPNTTTATQLGNVTSGLDKYGDQVNNADVPGTTDKNRGLVDLSKPANGDAPKVSDNTAATVGDLRNMGWIVSSNKTTGENGAVTTDEYSATVKNANEVKFVGEGTAVVSGKTDDQGVRTITVKVDDQTSTNNAVTPVVYTDKDGKQVYPTGKTDKDGNQIFNTKPDGKGEDVTGPVKTTINGPKGTTSPTSLSNVKNNIPAVNDADKKVTNADGTDKPDAGNVANINKAPLTAEEAADLLKPTTKDGKPNPNFVGNNAATVSDVLNAGWNLQNNGTAKDFVKPYDTVNFVNGLNTTAVVTTSDDGTTSNVTYNVTGLPVTYTTADGIPVSKIGDKFYKVNDKGQPVDEQGNPSTKVNNNGEPIDGNGNVINPIDTAAKPLKTSLVNPAPETNKTGTTSPTTLDNVTSKLTNYSDPEVNGKAPVRNNLVDLSKPEQGEPNVSDNTAATVGDLRNMGWIVSSNKTTGENGAVTTDEYSATVKNANEVKFVGEGTAVVSGKTDDQGVRTITVKVDDQTSTNNAVTPVVYTDKDGKQVYPTGKTDKDGNQIFNTKPDGKGEDVTGPVKTTINGPKGTTSPTSLSNVKNNIPAVNDADKKVTNADGTDKPDAGNVANINKAPLTAEEAADLLKPTTKDGKPNPNFVGNNAATVSDVLNAGWNLQNNGTAKDFVKPFDTVNFVNGVNTTAVVTTSEDGTTSNVTYNVTGLPVTYTTADGTPVSKIGDKYYKVNEQGQPLDSNGKPATKINENGVPVGEDGQPISEVNITDTPLTSKLVNPNAKNTDAEPNKKTTDPTQLGNVTSGLQKYGDTVDGKEVPGSTKANNGLVDLSTPTDGSKPKVSDNTAATVGDLRNMGWIVSSDKTTGANGTTTDTEYSETVKNANEVRFVGEGSAIVSGKTEGNIRTITVKVDNQIGINKTVTPVNYTKADGTKVYPKAVTDPKTGKEEVKFFENPDGSGAEVPKGDVITSINGPEGTTSPTTLKNVKNNIPNVNDGSKTITNPDGTEKTGDVENINKAPLTAEEAAALANPKTKDGQTNPKYIGNNAATVSDVLNAGWNLQNNGESRDFVKPYDTVNFVNGLGTTAVVTTREGNTASDVTFNVKAANGSVTVDENGVKVTTGEMKPAVGTDNKETGAIATPADPATAKQLKETLAAAEKDLSAARAALKEAEKALAADPKDPALQQAVADKKADVAAKQTPVDAAQKAHDEAGLNKVATVQNIAEAINNAGFNLKTSAGEGEKLTGTKDDGELIKPSNTVEMVAGNNLTVKQDANGKITYATKDNVTFTNVDTGTLNVGSPNTYTDGKGNTYTKVGANYYKPTDVVNGAPKPDATPVDVTTPVTPVSPVTMKAEAAKPATNNASDAQPSSALNITSKDGKPTQITGVGSTLNTKSVDTTPQGTASGATPNTTPTNLVDLEGTADAPVNKNAAATVGDLQNMGWVVSAKDGNGYKDVVKNANVVDFKGGKGIEITGKTLTDGTREITVGIKEGEVTNKVTITNANGTKTDAVKIGDNYYKVDKDGKPIGFEKGPDGKPAGTPLKVDPKTDKVTNAGAGFVTGNTVANAIQDSGWNVGIGSTDKDFSKDAKVYDKVNPNDDVKFANGANTNVSMVTVDALNEDGTKKATTFVKVDVNRDLKIDSVTTGGTAVDKNGNNLVKVGDDYYKESDIDPVTKQPKPNAKPVPKADVTPAKDGAMIVKNADGKDVVSATVGKDGSGVFGVNGKDGKDGVSITAKDGEGAIGVNGKDGATTTIKGDTITLTDKDKNTNTSTPTTNVLKDTNGNTNTSTADKTELKDKDGNTNTSTSTTVTLADKDKNTNTSTAAGTTYKDKDDNKTVVGPKEISLRDKEGNNTASLTNKDLLLNAKDPKTGVEKTSHVSGDKIAFSTTDEMEKVVDKGGKPVIDPATGKQKEKIKTPGNSTEYTNEGLKVIPNSTVARDANGNLTYVDTNNKPVMKDKDGNFVYMGKDGKPGEKYAGAVGALKPNVVDNTRVISFGMDKPVLDSNGNPVKGPDGKPVMTEGISAGMQQIHNVAPGTKDTDAVNVSQLKGIAGNVVNISNRMNRMGAQAAAMAGLRHLQYDPLEPTTIMAGIGTYKGEGALALGIAHYKNESTLFHAGASIGSRGEELMANAGVSWKFGARADETAVKDTFRQGPISASYTLQDKVSALEAQNQIQKDQLEELKALNEKQQAQIAELFKRIGEKI